MRRLLGACVFAIQAELAPPLNVVYRVRMQSIWIEVELIIVRKMLAHAVSCSAI